MADWVTISALATAGGTLALAGATYAAVRSSNRSAQVAELALQEQRRPVLVHSREEDPEQHISFADGRQMVIPGARGILEATESAIYICASLRNVGAGIAVLQGWLLHEVEGRDPESRRHFRQAVATQGPPEADAFFALARDQYVAPGDIGLWQGALRDAADPRFERLAGAARDRRSVSLDLLYTDQIGDQRTISRFALLPAEGSDGWISAASRHWYLDAPAPR